MNSNFYLTPEYDNFSKVFTRIQQPGGNTWKNMEVYIERLAKAMVVCEKDYQDTGYVKDKGIYKWAPSPKLSNPIDYGGSYVVGDSVFGEKISIHTDLSVTFCKSGFWIDPDSVRRMVASIDKLGIYAVLKAFPGSQVGPGDFKQEVLDIGVIA